MLMINLNQAPLFINKISSVCNIDEEILVNYGLIFLYFNIYKIKYKINGHAKSFLVYMLFFYNVTLLQFFFFK